MKLLEERIRKDGKVYPGGIVKVDSFLNHQMDVPFLSLVAKEMCRLYKDAGINKVLTVEASGIGIATLVALELSCPLVFAKKSKTANISDNLYHATAHSYTHGNDNELVVCADYLNADDCVLLVDDFLAHGEAFSALVSICKQANCAIAGCCAAVEKVNQGGGNMLREQGIRVESTAKIDKMNDKDGITFCD